MLFGSAHDRVVNEELRQPVDSDMEQSLDCYQNGSEGRDVDPPPRRQSSLRVHFCVKKGEWERKCDLNQRQRGKPPSYRGGRSVKGCVGRLACSSDDDLQVNYRGGVLFSSGWLRKWSVFTIMLLHVGMFHNKNCGSWSLFLVQPVLAVVETSSSSRRAGPHVDHRKLEGHLENGDITDFLDIKLKPMVIAPENEQQQHNQRQPSLSCFTHPQEMDSRIFDFCSMVGCNHPHRIFPYAGKFESEHVQFGLPCWYRVNATSKVTTAAATASARTTNQEESRISEGQAAYETGLLLTAAMNHPRQRGRQLGEEPDQSQDGAGHPKLDDDETTEKLSSLLMEMVETWDFVPKIKMDVLSEEEKGKWRLENQRQRETSTTSSKTRTTSTRSGRKESFTNDPMLPEQTHYQTIGLAEAWYIMKDQNAWGEKKKKEEVIVHVLDTGVDFQNHPDLGDNIWINSGEVCGDGIDNDNNGLIDDCNGWNHYYDNDNVGGGSHGTHVAGTIAANNDNNLGVAGVAGGQGGQRGISIMIGIGVYRTTAAAASIVYAADHGASISSNSWGYRYYSFPESDRVGFDYAISKGVTIVASAGNDRSQSTKFPAAHPGVIAVAATDDNGVAASFTTYGDWLNISAPGVNVLSTTLGGSYMRDSGTSMAAPHVSGVLAMGKMLKPNASSEQLKGCLYSTATNIDGIQEKSYYPGRMGIGLLNAPGVLGCLSIEGCGNYKIDDGELCDGNDFGDVDVGGFGVAEENATISCASMGYDFGVVSCSPDCKSYDYSRCRSIILEEPGLTGLAGSERRFRMEIDFIELTDIYFELSFESTTGIYADADLFVRKDYPPTLSEYDCVSASMGRVPDICTDTRPGVYHVLVRGHTDYEDVDLVVTANGRPRFPGCGNSFLDKGEVCDSYDLDEKTCQDFGYGDGRLACGSDCQHFDTSDCFYVYLNMSFPSYIQQGQFYHYMVDVRDLSDVSYIKFQLISGTTSTYDDADLYIRKNLAPSLDEYDCSSYNIGSDEMCLFDDGSASNVEQVSTTPRRGAVQQAEPGLYFILIHAFQQFAYTTILVTARGTKNVPTTAPIPTFEPTAAPTISAHPSVTNAPTQSGFCHPNCIDCYVRRIRRRGCPQCADCETLVCRRDPYCCSTHWDDSCGNMARRVCPCDDGGVTMEATPLQQYEP